MRSSKIIATATAATAMTPTIALMERFGKELQCSICLQLMHRPMMLPCHHAFCGRCISSALEYSARCPICKEVGPQPSTLSSRRSPCSQESNRRQLREDEMIARLVGLYCIVDKGAARSAEAELGAVQVREGPVRALYAA